MPWPPIKACEQVFLCRQIINNILIKVWLNQSNYHMAAGSEQRRAWGIIPLQGLEDEAVITIDEANIPGMLRWDKHPSACLVYRLVICINVFSGQQALL